MGLRRGGRVASTRASRSAAALAVASVVWLPSPASAQAVVRGADVTADLTAGDGSAVVTVAYRISDASAVTDLSLELLGFGEATAEELSVDGAPVVLWPASGSRRSATVSLPRMDAPGDRVVSLAYTLSNAVLEEGGALTVRVPIVSLELPPEAEARAVFRAEVTIPEHWSVSGGFPTGLTEGSPGVYAVDLPVVPAFVALRGRTDGAWAPGLALIVELLTVAILAGFGWIGWRHLRSVAE